MKVRSAIGFLAAVATLAFAATAPAATYCVGSSGCDAAHTKATVAAALAAASTDGQNDVVQVGSGSFATDEAQYTGSHTVFVQGTGQSTTTLQDNAADGRALVCHGSAAGVLRISSLAVRMGAGTNAGIIDLTCPVRVHDVLVNTEFAPSAAGISVNAGAATITNSSVLGSETSIMGHTPSEAVYVHAASLQISDSQLLGQLALVADGGGTTPTSIQAHRLSITSSGVTGAAVISDAAALSIDDSLLQVSADAIGLEVATEDRNGSLTARQLTVIHSDGTGAGMAVFDTGGFAGRSATLSVLDSVFARGDGSPDSSSDIQCVVHAGQSAHIAIDYTSFATPVGNPCTGPGTSTYSPGPNNDSGVNPRFSDPTHGDYTLSPTSPLRLRDPSPLATGESPTDLLGQPRIRGERRDLGAYEYQPPAPSAVTQGTSHLTPTRAVVHGTVGPRGLITTYHFVYGTSTAYGHSTTVITDVSLSSPSAVSVPIGRLRAGHTYHYRLIADNGITTHGADRTFHTPPFRCVVPNLIGKHLRAARRSLRRAHCRLGRVQHRHGAPGEVISQRPRPRRSFRAGHRVNVTIGQR